MVCTQQQVRQSNIMKEDTQTLISATDVFSTLELCLLNPVPVATTKHFYSFSSYIFTCQLVVGVLLTLASCIVDPCLLTILDYIKNYNPKLLVIIIIIMIVIMMI